MIIIIRTKYYCTAVGAGRISATDLQGNRTSIPYPHHIGNASDRHEQAALALCKKMGYTGNLIPVESKDYDFAVVSND